MIDHKQFVYGSQGKASDDLIIISAGCRRPEPESWAWIASAVPPPALVVEDFKPSSTAFGNAMPPGFEHHPRLLATISPEIAGLARTGRDVAGGRPQRHNAQLL